MPVMSVTGPIEAQALGRTLLHEHIIIGMPGEELDPGSARDRREIVAIATDQLQKLKDHGVGTIVDPCPIELGRDPQLYAEVAQRSGVNIIFSTGFYMESLGIPMYWRARDPEEIAEFYLRELADGVGDTGLRPGVIKAATGVEVTDAESRCLAGAAIAQRQANCAIITHTEQSKNGERQQDIFAANGANLSRVMIGHQDEHLSPEPMIRLAERGTFVAVDRVGVDLLASDETRADNVAAMVKSGFARNTCLSHDCVCAFTSRKFPFRMPPELQIPDTQTWMDAAKPMTHLFTDFLPKLEARGVTRADVDTILRDNPRRLLAGEG
jgi:phosphotriesterase-related protein